MLHVLIQGVALTLGETNATCCQKKHFSTIKIIHNEKKEVSHDALCILFNEAMNYEKNKTALIETLYESYGLARNTLYNISCGKKLPTHYETRFGFMKGLLQYLEDKRYDCFCKMDTEKVKRIDYARYMAILQYFNVYSNFFTLK